MIVTRHRSGEGYRKKKNSAALKFPKSTVASKILKLKRFSTTRTLPSAGRQAKLSNWHIHLRRAQGGAVSPLHQENPVQVLLESDQDVPECLPWRFFRYVQLEKTPGQSQKMLARLHLSPGLERLGILPAVFSGSSLFTFCFCVTPRYVNYDILCLF